MPEMSKEEAEKFLADAKQKLVEEHRLIWSLAQTIGPEGMAIAVDHWEDRCMTHMMKIVGMSVDIGPWAVVASGLALISLVEGVATGQEDDDSYNMLKVLMRESLSQWDARRQKTKEVRDSANALTKAGIPFESEEFREGMQAAAERILRH